MSKNNKIQRKSEHKIAFSHKMTKMHLRPSCIQLCFRHINIRLYLNVLLRLRSLFVKTDWVCHVWCNFLPVYTCQTTVIFGTLKDDSLKINSLASNIFFQSQKRVPKWRQHFVKMINHFFVEKLQILFSSDHTILFKFYQHVVQILIK